MQHLPCCHNIYQHRHQAVPCQQLQNLGTSQPYHACGAKASCGTDGPACTQRQNLDERKRALQTRMRADLVPCEHAVESHAPPPSITSHRCFAGCSYSCAARLPISYGQTHEPSTHACRPQQYSCSYQGKPHHAYIAAQVMHVTAAQPAGCGSATITQRLALSLRQLLQNTSVHNCATLADALQPRHLECSAWNASARACHAGRLPCCLLCMSHGAVRTAAHMAGHLLLVLAAGVGTHAGSVLARPSVASTRRVQRI